MKRYGLIGTCYNSGISNIAWGFAEHLDMKTLLVDGKPFAKFPQRFRNHRITQTMSKADIDWLLTDIDVLMAIETPYSWVVFEEAQKRGVKVVFMPMIEWLDRKRRELRFVDLFVCPSTYTLDIMEKTGFGSCVLVPCEVPVDLAKFTHRTIKQARTFLHVGGHGGIGGRNSTIEFIKATQLVKSDAKFIVRTQFAIEGKIEDPRIQYIEGNVENYWDLFDEGDVWVMPWKYGVAALGLQESMAAGMLPMITKMDPFDKYMPEELMIEPASLEWRHIHAGQKELYAHQTPELIAAAIDRIYNMDIRPLLQWTQRTAQEWSWDTWRPKYQAMFDAL